MRKKISINERTRVGSSFYKTLVRVFCHRYKVEEEKGISNKEEQIETKLKEKKRRERERKKII